MIQTKGNLIAMAKAQQLDIIVHGCNCHNTMGGGIARQIRVQIPDAWLADQETIAGDRNKLGTYTLGHAIFGGGAVIVVNAYTQYCYNRRDTNSDLFEYESFQTILDKLAVRFGICRIGFPMIGMGLAGGDPKRIIPMIEAFATKVESQGGSVTLVEYAV